MSTDDLEYELSVQEAKLREATARNGTSKSRWGFGSVDWLRRECQAIRVELARRGI